MAAVGAGPMTAGDRPLGLLLMGGRSRRMGVDKAWLPVDGEPLWRRQWRTLQAVTAPVLRAVRHGHPVGPDLLVDGVVDPGPAWPLATLLAARPQGWVMVLAVDLLGVTPALLTALWARRIPGGVCLAQIDGRDQPLCAVWHGGCGAAFLPSAVGLSLQTVLTRVPVCRYPVPEAASSLVNLNTPAQWRQWRGER